MIHGRAGVAYAVTGGRVGVCSYCRYLPSLHSNDGHHGHDVNLKKWFVFYFDIPADWLAVFFFAHK